MYKVLLVDDEPIAIEGLEMLISWEKHGFQVQAACNNGEDAINHIRNHKPDLVVTDIQMPVLNGLELIEQTRGLGNDSTMFIITSGFSNFDYAKRAIRLGVSHYLTKPINSREANAALLQLQEVLQERERQQFIKASADRYTIKGALSLLVLGGTDKERLEAQQQLLPLTAQMKEWNCLQLLTDSSNTGLAREAAHLFAMERDGCYVIDGHKGSIGLVCGFPSNKSDDDCTEGGIREYAERLLQSVRSKTTGRVGIAVGSSVSSLDELSRCWESASEAYRFLFLEAADIVQYEDIQTKDFSGDPLSLKAADTIVEALENGKPEALEASIREVFRSFEEERIMPELVGIFSTHVMMRCAAVYKDHGGNPEELLRDFSQRHLPSCCFHLQDSADYLMAYCLKSQSAIRLLLEKNTGGTPAKVAEFLKQNYRDTLTIKDIAERFYMNPVYLGQLFAKKYGKGIVDYIHDLRIEDAKQQLAETNEALYLIGEKLGYSSYQYFMKQFEKRVLMKPADYRSHFKTT
ncbi:two-component system, response regulator YesN [Paenibacillus catalpae]|uniref:Two-component system, response regulator YesN n=2 Tax=Paenibacillus catalpae TaxID=1045775 RepID=A0A1I2FR73_9BACL|nr:two-component system, response regulator YesN [Paenibacillus catalpae]